MSETKLTNDVDAVKTTPDSVISDAPVIKTEPSVTKDTKAKKKVEVDPDVLQKLLDEVEELKKNTGLLERTASQDQIRKIEAMRASGKLVKSIKVRKFNGEIVVGWKLTKDEVWVDADGKLHEEQEVDVFTEQGSTHHVKLLQFTRQYTHEEYEVISEEKLANGDLMLKIILDSGKELSINSKFIN